MLGIDEFKRMPHHSSSHLGRIMEEANAWVDAANSKYKEIARLSDMQELVSQSGLSRCFDNLAAIRQIEAAIAGISDHFSATLAAESFELPHNRIKESLRKAVRDTTALAKYFER